MNIIENLSLKICVHVYPVNKLRIQIKLYLTYHKNRNCILESEINYYLWLRKWGPHCYLFKGKFGTTWLTSYVPKKSDY